MWEIVEIGFEKPIEKVTLISDQKKVMQKGLKKESIRTHNHLSMSRWCHFWDGG